MDSIHSLGWSLNLQFGLRLPGAGITGLLCHAPLYIQALLSPLFPLSLALLASSVAFKVSCQKMDRYLAWGPGQAGRGFLSRKVDSWVVLWLHTCNSTQFRKMEDSVAGWW